MKKFLTCLLSIALAAVMAFSFTGCFGGGEVPEYEKPVEYIIQYTDDSGTHKFTVLSDTPYALDVIPERTGYIFTGLFDAEVGGTQYVSALGASLAPFTDKKNMVLFPQFKAKEYTVILDYQGAPVTGSRQLTVAYGSSLPELPKNLTVGNKEFTGWYTKANSEGVQVADKYGLIPLVSVLNENNFDLSSASITLFAGFEMQKVKVTCCFDAGMDTETVEIEFGTPVSQIVTKTRVNGEAPLTWSKTQNGEPFNGTIESDTVLYALEYAPVIDFDCNGGNKVNSIVARAGATIALPTPTKDMAKFAYWEDLQGNKYTSTTMPEKSISLKAVWQAKIVFDENGGSDVDDISVAAGETIKLPTPEKDGFIFAGWYTADKTQYTSTKMPSAGIALKAGWYKEKEDLIILIKGDNEKRFYNSKMEQFEILSLDLSQYLPDNFSGIVKLEGQFKTKNSTASYSNSVFLDLDFYSTGTISDSYKLWGKRFTLNSSSYTSYSYSFSAKISGNKVFGALSSSTGALYYTWLSDYRINLTYPDTTNLYL